MSPSSWLDLPAARGGLLAATLVLAIGAIVWFVDRWLDVRDNRRTLRRRQLRRYAPVPNENRRGVAAPTAVNDLGADYPAFDKVHRNGRSRETSV